MEEIKCAYCGSTVQEGSEVCPFCNAPLKNEEEAAEVILQPAETKGSSVSAMVLGIISAAVCWYPVGSIAGIILGAIALAKAKKFKKENGKLDGKGKAAKVTGLVGLIGGIVMTLVWICIIAFTGLAVYAVQTGGYLE